MKSSPECFGCVLRQAVSAVTLNVADPDLQIQTLRMVLNTMELADNRFSPSELAGETNRVMQDTLGIADLYLKEKETSHIKAMKYIEDLRALIQQGSNSLEQGLKVSAAGNIIDIIHAVDYDLWEEVEKTVNQDIQGGGLEAFSERLSNSSHLLYLADNVGETVFDRIFIETLDIPVIYAVKSGPILNDATLENARAAGIDQVAEIVETGSCAPGTILSQSTKEFQELFRESPLVLAKGQANFETVDEQGDKVFFLLRTKCPEVSRLLNIPVGNLVLKQAKSLN